MPLDYSKLPFDEKSLHVPPLDELADVLARGLASNFEKVSVKVVDCPDLTQPPYGLTSPGFGGSPKLVELGGPPYLVPEVRRDKVYSLQELAAFLKRDPAFLVGAGAGPWPHVGVNCEGVINLSVRNGTAKQGSRVVSVTPVGGAKGSAGYLLQRLPDSETRTALLGNYLLSDGLPGKVLQIDAQNRTGDDNFITAIRETLKQQYGDKVVGMGGAFLLEEGKAKHHVMPDFSATALLSDDDVNNWLHFFEMRAPLLHLGTLVTGDMELDLRLQHFHGWGEHGDGGHYHGDTTPKEARYRAILTPAGSVLRVDRPPHTHGLGRD